MAPTDLSTFLSAARHVRERNPGPITFQAMFHEVRERVGETPRRSEFREALIAAGDDFESWIEDLHEQWVPPSATEPTALARRTPSDRARSTKRMPRQPGDPVPALGGTHDLVYACHDVDDHTSGDGRSHLVEHES